MKNYIQKIFGTEKPKTKHQIIISMSTGTDYYLKVVENCLVDQNNRYEIGKIEKKVLKISGKLLKESIDWTRKNQEKTIGNMHFIKPCNVKPLVERLEKYGYEVSFN